jgi:hypothetical protein
MLCLRRQRNEHTELVMLPRLQMTTAICGAVAGVQDDEHGNLLCLLRQQR